MTNRAIAFSEVGAASVLKETSIPLASPTGWDIFVKNLAVSVNLLDVKARTQGKDWPELTWSDLFRVLGYDGADIVEEVGPKAEDLFKKGDHVCRIVGRKPQTLDWAAAAAFPLVTLTAYELMVESMEIQKGDTGSLLIVNAAGGNVVATASRKETIDWVKKLGAAHVINHREKLGPQVEKLGFPIKYALLFFDPGAYIPQVVPFVQPLGKIGSILSPQKADFVGVHRKRIFTSGRRGQILNQVADLVDAGSVESNLTETHPFNLENLQKAHKQVESSTVVGKIALTLDENSFK
ncbi:quinone oxidoreductase [Umbelopsis sp. PMI_123]|nr:quinone oxidoreductase [Umbelopsis sp. PMI_123]